MDLLAARARWRTLAILGLMYAIMLQLGYFVALVAGFKVGLASILLVSIVALLIDFYSYWRCDKIVLKITNAQVVSREQFPKIHNIIEELCIASGLPKPTIAVVQDESLNAFATGRDPLHAAVAVNTGLLNALNENELRGVLAHEISHIYNRDIFVNSVAAVCVRIVSAIANGMIFAGIALATAPSSPGRKTQEQQNAENSQRGFGLILMLIGGLLAITFVPALLVLQFAISRTRESMADLTGVKFTNDPESLASALRIITGSEIPTRLKAAGTSHMWISRPLYVGGGLANWVSSLTSSHPDPNERIATIDAVARGQSVDLAMAKQMQTMGSIVGAGVIAIGLVVIPGYWIGTNPLQVGSSYDYGADYTTTEDGGESISTNSDNSVPPEESNPDASGGITDANETSKGDDSTGEIGQDSGDSGADGNYDSEGTIGGIG